MSTMHLLGGVIALVLLGACSAGEPVASGATPAPGDTSPAGLRTDAAATDVDPTAVGSTAVGSTTPSATAGPASSEPAAPPSPADSPAEPLTWTKAGRLDVGDGEFLGLARVGSAYVAWGHAYPDDAARDEGQWVLATWASLDLDTWTQTLHRAPVRACEGWAPGLEMESESVSSDGTTFVLVASQAAPDPAVEDGCNRREVIALSTGDGYTWTRSVPLLASDGTSTGSALGPWRVPGGWETHAGPLEEAGASVWQSADLVTWQQTGVIKDQWGQGVAAVDDDGTRLSFRSRDAGEALIASSDGVQWRTIRTLPSSYVGAGVFEPVAADQRWLVVLAPTTTGKARLLFSEDLETWERINFPRAGIDSLLRTPAGWIATGYTPEPPSACEGEGDEMICPMEGPPVYLDPAVYTSVDGRVWVERPDSMLPTGRMPVLVDDGSSVLGLAAQAGATGRVAIWRLGPIPGD